MAAEQHEYWRHNLSPFIFETSKLDFSWVLTWYGIPAVLLFFAGGYALVTWLLHRAEKDADAAALGGGTTGGTSVEGNIQLFATLQFLVGFGFFLFCVLFGINWWHIHKDPTFDWGLRWYSTMYLLGFVQVYLVCRRWIKKRQIMLTPMLLDSLLAYLFFGMILGARAAYVFIYNWDDYSKNMGSIVKVWQGGLSFHGGIVGVVTAMFIFSYRHRIPFFHLADRLSMTVPFGIAIGRIGNFMNGELYGRVIQSHVPWAIIFPEGGPQPRHPSQLYQSLGEGWGLLLTLYLVSRRKHAEGVIGCAFIFFYAFYRFFVEFFREADAQLSYYFNNTLTMGQILCLVTMLIAVIIFLFVRNNVVEGSPEWQRRIDEFYARREKIEAAMDAPAKVAE